MRILRQALILSAVGGFLIACDSTNPFTTNGGTGGTGGTGGGTTPTGDTIPASVAGNVTAVSYSPGSATITVEGINLDEVPFAAVYRRNPALDVPGYQAYTAQDDALDRHVTAFVMQSGNSGAVRGAVVVSGGQFNRYFGGVYYERDNYSPATGQVSYAGRYAGLTNVPGDGGDLIPVPPGIDPSLVPVDAAEVTGRIFLNANFADNSVNGGIYNRVLTDYAVALPDLALIATDIADDGSFSGTVEYSGVVGETIGEYAGIFGGPDAESVAGGVRLNEWDGKGNPLGFENEEEYGVFVLDQCGTAGASAAICADVNPGAGVP
ncbi:thymidylate synthase [Marimonas arenosa]|uniref:Thymidylate synthase n=1 Tax=Marimonas arenosa TaxID=1795305 RepID=A0AAE3W9U8_9RHOB|nr:thymidylate synthase [Marimonas arenosa]MDQ2089251.1 thymidylate synthase [Marimonas arenosa]